MTSAPADVLVTTSVPKRSTRTRPRRVAEAESSARSRQRRPPPAPSTACSPAPPPRAAPPEQGGDEQRRERREAGEGVLRGEVEDRLRHPQRDEIRHERDQNDEERGRCRPGRLRRTGSCPRRTRTRPR